MYTSLDGSPLALQLVSHDVDGMGAWPNEHHSSLFQFVGKCIVF